MTTVFLSHSSNDKDLAKKIAVDLKNHSIDVWLDEWEIKVGHSISREIASGLKKADFVAVLLTKYSVNSGWVEKEWQAKIGEEAEKRKVIILPLKCEDCEIPVLLQDKKYADFVSKYESGFEELLEAIRMHSGHVNSAPPSAPTLPLVRATNFAVGSIPFPCFFPSVSGAAKNSLSPLEHLQILVAIKYPHFLISSYDIYNSKKDDRNTIRRFLDKATLQGQVILMDSGLYEKKWLHAKSWTKGNFREILRNIPCHLAFCYDNPDPKGSTSQIASAIARSLARDRKKGDMNTVNPLIHATDPTDFSSICCSIAKQIDPILIAVPERELGEGVLAIAKTIRKIREDLNETGRYYPLHIIGTGNPLSILVYTACGADSFDGLDWCQTVVDHATGRLYHSLQLDFFANQTRYGSEDLPYLTRVFAHNLVFYLRWMEEIGKSIREGSITEMIDKFIPKEIHSKFKDFLPENID